MPLLKLRFALPEVVIDINRVDGLEYARVDNGTLCIGGRTPQVVLAEVVDRRQRRVRRERAAEPAPSTAATSVRDPVCGMSVDVATALYRSGDVYFCAAGCLQAYEAHPEQLAFSR